MKITDDMLTEPPVDPLAPRVEAVIKAIMGRFPGLGKTSQAAYYEEVHQHLAPLARTLERENGELRSEIDRLNAMIRDQFAARCTTPDRMAIVEECAKVCDEYAADRFALFKGRKPYTGREPGRADPYFDGASDGADRCAQLIRELKTAPTSDQGEKS